MKCPICDQERQNLFCPECGFDFSRHYANYPTFGTPVRGPAPSALRKKTEYRRKTAQLVEPVETVTRAKSAQQPKAAAPKTPPGPQPEPYASAPYRGSKPAPEVIREPEKKPKAAAPKESPTPQAEPAPRPAPEPVRKSVQQPVTPVAVGPNPKNKWVALLLCFFLGMFGVHKFYEGKKGMGVLYLFTMGLFGYGWLFDLIALLFKPNPYYPNIKR